MNIKHAFFTISLMSFFFMQCIPSHSDNNFPNSNQENILNFLHNISEKNTQILNELKDLHNYYLNISRRDGVPTQSHEVDKVIKTILDLELLITQIKYQLLKSSDI